MKQIILFSALFFSCQLTISAQNTEFAPIGAYWKYNWANVVDGGQKLTKVVGDTTINGQLYKKLYEDEFWAYGYPTTSHSYRTALLSVRNDSVFMNQYQKNTFLYCFKAQIGDTVKYETRSVWVRYAVADSVGRMDLNGANRRVVYFTKYCRNTTTNAIKKNGRSQLVENYGLLNEGLTWSEPDCGFLDFNHYSLICYQSGSFVNPANSVCVPTVATNELIYTQISIAPNPANTDLTLNFPSELQLNKVELVNNLGQKVSVFASENNQKINVSAVPNGVYFLNLWFDKQRVVKKIMVQH